jgi:hypothetical protein
MADGELWAVSIWWRRSVTASVYLESSRKNANLLQGIWRNSKLVYSTLDRFTEWIPGNLKIDSWDTVYVQDWWDPPFLFRHGPIRQLPCRPLFLSRDKPIPSNLSYFPLANSCGNGTYVFEIPWMCVSRSPHRGPTNATMASDNCV